LSTLLLKKKHRKIKNKIMNSLKTLGIIGIILSSLLMICSFDSDIYTYGLSGVGFWLFSGGAYLLAISIVAIVQSKYIKK